MNALPSVVLAAVCLMSCPAASQTSTTQGAAPRPKTATATTPKAASNGYAVAPVVLRDEDCARDYANAFKAGGVSTRKQLADVLLYGCAERGVGVFKGASQERKRITPTATFRRVSLVCISGCGDRLILKGWVADADFHAGTEAEIRAAVAALAEHQ